MGILLVAGAIVSEVAATLALRASHGLTRLAPSVLVVVGYGLAFVLLAQALKSLNVGPVYAVWSGVGTVGAFAGGVLLFGESVRPATVIGVALVVLGVAVMYLGGGMEH
ncbi:MULTISPECIES: DMT family transporter [Streptomyces]|jgi:small multidrug resistance pump|uniref:DMT family transporter n=2 Tax=Streptomyces TaxID=1883 RepID=A0ABW9IQ60_STRGJ|nr:MULTISPECIES: multidrug efflux SMR transporter [Streptomyces]QEU63962.1 QacE family quaternary ammonium compound efflux SMR transporter [Streptomyces galilaeus]GGW75784.1 QacE family quaternary ammonium compound efflux SMR transporter [Streptomyces galilaeus]